MKNATRYFLVLLVSFVALVRGEAASAPVVDITVKDRPRGRVVKQVTADAKGNFLIGTLPEGSYVLEFRAKAAPDLKKQQFWIAVDGTKQSGKQGGITGDSLVGGVALNVEVARGSKVSGQVGMGANARQQEKTKMVWIPPILGSHLPGRWVEEGSAEEVLSRTRGNVRTDQLRQIQDNALTSGGR
jgi:hypothetical protein